MNAMRTMLVTATAFAVGFATVSIVLLIAPVGAGIDCPVCSGRLTFALVALESAMAGATCGFITAAIFHSAED